MSNQFTNPQLLDMFSDHVPTENGKSSDAILAEFGNNDQGDWALVIQFEAKEIQENDPFTGPTTLSLIHISEPTRLLSISYAVFCLKKKKQNK